MSGGRQNKDQESDSATTRKALQWTTSFLLLAGMCTAACLLFANIIFGLLGVMLSILAVVKLKGLASQTSEVGAQVDRMRIIAFVLLGISAALCLLAIVIAVFVTPAIEAYLELVSPGFNQETLSDILSGGSNSSVWG